jgi:hypothetical protein
MSWLLLLLLLAWNTANDFLVYAGVACEQEM